MNLFCLLMLLNLILLKLNIFHQIDDALSQFEAADFQDYSEDFYDLPREFNILGSCLFHKGYLLASHLPRDDMVDVLLWCSYHQVRPIIITIIIITVIATFISIITVIIILVPCQ